MVSKVEIKKTYKEILAAIAAENIAVTLKETGEYKERKVYTVPLKDGGEYEFYTYVESTKVPSIMGRFNNSPKVRDAIKGRAFNDKYNFHFMSCEELKESFIRFITKTLPSLAIN